MKMKDMQAYALLGTRQLISNSTGLDAYCKSQVLDFKQSGKCILLCKDVFYPYHNFAEMLRNM